MSAPLSTGALECLQWLHANLVLCRGVSLSEEQLLHLEHAVGVDAVSSRALHPCCWLLPLTHVTVDECCCSCCFRH